MTLSKIEKCARLMGYEVDKSETNGGGTGNTGFNLFGDAVLDWHNNITFNPLTNKADLVDLMCAVGVDVNWFNKLVMASTSKEDEYFESRGHYASHPDKQTALAHAVVDVACQIYDRKFGDKE